MKPSPSDEPNFCEDCQNAIPYEGEDAEEVFYLSRCRAYPNPPLPLGDSFVARDVVVDRSPQFKYCSTVRTVQMDNSPSCRKYVPRFYASNIWDRPDFTTTPEPDVELPAWYERLSKAEARTMVVCFVILVGIWIFFSVNAHLAGELK